MSTSSPDRSEDANTANLLHLHHHAPVNEHVDSLFCDVDLKESTDDCVRQRPFRELDLCHRAFADISGFRPIRTTKVVDARTIALPQKKEARLASRPLVRRPSPTDYILDFAFVGAAAAAFAESAFFTESAIAAESMAIAAGMAVSVAMGFSSAFAQADSATNAVIRAKRFMQILLGELGTITNVCSDVQAFEVLGCGECNLVFISSESRRFPLVSWTNRP